MSSQSNKSSPRKELRTSTTDWRGMTSSHRRHKKPYVHRAKEGNVWPFLKRLFIVVIVLVLAHELYSMRQECMDILGENHILCMD